jgi:hypothetical protein
MPHYGFCRHREAYCAHKMPDDRRALHALVRFVRFPRGDALLDFRGEAARLDEPVAPGGPVHAVELATKLRDRLRGGGVRRQLTRQLLQQCNCTRAGLAKALAQRPQRITRPCDGLGARHQGFGNGKADSGSCVRPVAGPVAPRRRPA